jgi:DNA polymerase-3 subunit gamma/tau
MKTLFLKYRPQVFSDLVGQKSIIKTLKNAIKSDKPAHAYLFAGSRGTGKTSVARIFSKALNCPKIVNGEPCGKCDICIDTMNGSLVDVIEIDAASNGGIEQIRDLREKILFSPNRAEKKVYIIDEVHMLSTAAFNALLKTLEEPPEHVFFLCATTELHKIPDTIISRCQTFLFQKFTIEEIVDRLAKIAESEKIIVDSESLKLIAQKAEGGLRDAISLLEQMTTETESKINIENIYESLGIAKTQTLEKFFESITNNEVEVAMEILKKVVLDGHDLRTFGHNFLNFLRTELHKNLKSPEAVATILPIIEEFEKAIARIKTSPIVELPFEIAVINLCFPKTKQVLLNPVFTKPEKTITSLPKEKAISQPPKTEALSKKETKLSPKKTSSENSKIQISIDSILTKKGEIAEKSEIPAFAKKSFETSFPRIEDEKIIFKCSSTFHKNQLDKKEIKIAIQNAINEIFGGKFTVIFENGETELPNSKIESESKKNEKATIDDFQF